MKLLMPRRTVHLAVGCLLMVSATATAQPETKPGLIRTIIQGIAHSAFFGISFEQSKGVAVGMGGAINESSDGGQTWAPISHGLTELALLSVDRRGPHTIAVGQAGAVMIEEQPGKWALIDAGTPSRLFSVSVNSTGLAIAVGEFGTLLKSPDGGRTWAPAAPDWSQYADAESFGTGEPNMYAAHVSESGEITVAGEFGVILRSNDQAASWTVLRPVTAGVPTLFALYIPADGLGNSYAVGQTGELLLSPDNGLTWAKCNTSTQSNFLGVTASASGEVVVTGMRTMYRSSNGGVTWESIEEGDTKTDWYQAVRTVPTTGKVLAVGHSGKVIQIGG